MFSTLVVRNDQSTTDRKEKWGYALQKPYTIVYGTRTIAKLSGGKFHEDPKVKQIHLIFKIILAPFTIIFSPVLLPIAFIGKYLVNKSLTHKKAMESWKQFQQLNQVDIPLVPAKDFKEKQITEKELLEQSCIKPQTLAKHDLKVLPKEVFDINFGFKRYFGKVLVINPPTDLGKQRWEIFKKNMKIIDLKEGQDYERFPGYDAKKVPQKYVDRFDKTSSYRSNIRGAMACFLAQLDLFKHVNKKFENAKKKLHKAFEEVKGARSISKTQMNNIRAAQHKVREYSVVCTFEDNAAWGRLVNKEQEVSIKGEGYRWRKMLAGLPSDWDFINLWPTTIPGTKEYKKVNPYLVKCNGATAAKAVIIHHTAYPKIIEKLEKTLKNPNVQTEHVDQIYRKMQHEKKLNVYAPHKSFIFREFVNSLVGCKYSKRLQLDCV